eukprot:jgi/Ulvmu1/2285/UM013_0132.1
MIGSTVSGKALRFSRVARQQIGVNRRNSVVMSAETLDKTTPESKWKELLTAQEYHVIRNKGTEPPGTGEYNKGDFKGGYFVCRACNAKLYDADMKFNSGCGWPAFYDNLPDTVERITDSSLGMSRTEILCKNCGGHLGHVFKGEGFPTPTDERHCVNSLSIKYVAADE